MSDLISQLADTGVDAAVGAATNEVNRAAQSAQSSSAGHDIMTGAEIGGTVAGIAATTGIVGATTVAADVAGTVAATVTSAAMSMGASAGTAIGLGATIGSAIPIPGIGAAIGAAIGAIIAAGEAIADVTKDKFHPTRRQTNAWRAMFQLWPALIFLNVDKAVTPAQAARLERYFNVVGGFVKKGQKGNTGEEYNPVSNDSCSNPYMCKADPDDPLTDEKVLTQYYNQLQAAAKKYKTDIWNLPAAAYAEIAPPLIRDKASAKALLQFLRESAGSIADWSQVTGNKDLILDEVRVVRLAAGESGPDPVLARLFGGNVTVYPPPAGYPPPMLPTGKYHSTLRYGSGGSAMETLADGSYRIYSADGSARSYSAYGVFDRVTAKPGTYPTPVTAEAIFPAHPDAIHVLNADSGWVYLGVVSLASVVAAGALVLRERGRSKARLALLSSRPNAVGHEAFERVLKQGITDGELEQSTTPLGSMLYFHKAFSDARQYGFSPTQIASKGKYFETREPLPIRVLVQPDGRLRLDDGRRRYMAAKAAGARSILADVVLLGPEGAVVEQKRAAVKLI